MPITTPDTEQNRTEQDKSQRPQIDVLIASGSELIRSVGEAAIKRHGFTVETAETADQTIAKLREKSYRLLRIALWDKTPAEYYKIPEVIRTAIQEGVQHILYEDYEQIHPETLAQVNSGKVIIPPYAHPEETIELVTKLLSEEKNSQAPGTEISEHPTQV